ncbi:hypothetical protein NEIG_00917 [Nematocida sp. ERTm5]|nr:hypothetical protein NEIRO02_0415 [Nematocida sp. AWRm79]KAI5182690.1 hypothetical protein NEIRO03_0341 [Nematocida sp. AWRm78]OAG33362.1 hypothetical protein NEIG_00917 [Nematocida sp. ERTm5]
MDLPSEQDIVNMNLTTKKMLLEKNKSFLMNSVLHIKEEKWDKTLFMATMCDWMRLCTSLDEESSAGSTSTEEIMFWEYITEILESISTYTSEEEGASKENIDIFVLSINSMPVRASSLFYLSRLININQQSGSSLYGRFSSLISDMKRLYNEITERGYK